MSSPAYPGAIQANVFDGKSDGKSPSPFCLRNLPLESFPVGAKDYKFRQKRNWELPGLGNFGVLSPTFSHVATAGHARQTFIRSAQLSAFRCLGLPSHFEKMCCEGQLRSGVSGSRRPSPVCDGPRKFSPEAASRRIKGRLARS